MYIYIYIYVYITIDEYVNSSKLEVPIYSWSKDSTGCDFINCSKDNFYTINHKWEEIKWNTNVHA